MIIFLVLGLSLTTDGYFRVRPKILNNLSFQEEWIDYIDSRFSLRPTLSFGDIRIIGRVDILDNVVWGYNTRGALDHPIAETISFSDIIGKETRVFNLKRLFLEAKTDIGIFRIGFMPSHWGLGLVSQGGDEITQDFGDTYARVLFATKPLGPQSNFITAILMDKVVEGTIFTEQSSESLDVDTDQVGIVLFYDGDIKGGTYTTARFQTTTKSFVFAPNIYFERKGKIYLSSEIFGLFGKFNILKDQTINISSFGGVLRFGYNFDGFFPSLEVGYTSPKGDNEFDTEQNKRGTEMKGGAFDPDWRPALLLFSFIGGRKFSFFGKNYSYIAESRSVFSATYLKVNLEINLGIKIIPSFIMAFESRKFGFLGAEPDLEIRTKTIKESGKESDIFLSLKLGYLFVGDKLIEEERKFEKGVQKKNVFGIVGLIGYEF